MKISLYKSQFRDERNDYPGSAWEEVLISLKIPESKWDEIGEVELKIEDLKY